MPRQSPAPRASLLIPTTSQAERLGECLAAIERRVPASAAVEVVVVASAATPEVHRVLAESRDPRLRVVDSPVNLGVAGGYNRARAAASGELLCLLHDDTVIHAGWLEAMLDAAERWPDTGVFASVLTYPDGRLQSAGGLLWADAVAYFAWPLETDPASLRDADPVDYGASSALAVRAAVYDAIGGLDEALHPGYYVDADCCYACREVGRVVRLVPAARATHHRGSSSTAAYRDFLVARNRERFLAKWRHRLGDRPPFDPSPAGMAAGRARAKAEAAALIASGGPRRALVPRYRCDPGEQELRLAALENELLVAYRRHLEALLSVTTEGLRWLEGKTLALAGAAGIEVERDAAGWPRFDRLVEELAARLCAPAPGEAAEPLASASGDQAR